MEVRTKLKRIKGLCTITFSLLFNDTEKSKLEKFGYPSINIGGQFQNEKISFTLENENKKLSEFPIVQKFDGIELGHDLAKQQADLYTEIICNRITNVWQNFKSIPDDFGGENVFTI